MIDLKNVAILDNVNCNNYIDRDEFVYNLSKMNNSISKPTGNLERNTNSVSCVRKT